MEMQEPCIIFSPHWSLRLGSSVHFLRRWCGDPSSLLVLENGLDAGLGLLPFQPMEMKVLQCSFLSGIRSQKVQPLLKLLQPKLVLFPESLSSKINISNVNSYSIMHYSENETVHIPSFKYTSEVVIATDLGSKFTCKAPKGKKIDITRLKGELLMDHGKYKLLPESDPVHSRQSQPLVHWGSPDMEKLLDVLSKAGVNASIEQHMGDTKAENNGGIIHVHDPNNAFVEVQPTCTIISAADQRLASFISEAVGSILDGV